MGDEKFYTYEPYKPELCEESLEHHGILGMHWGKRNGPPYPLGSDISTGSRLKSGTGSVKKKSTSGGLVAKYKAKKVRKQRVQAAEKARQAKQQKAEEARAKQEAQDRAEREALEREQWRQDVMRNADIESAKDHTDLFSTDEINQIINKYNANQKLNQLVEDVNKAIEQPQAQPQQNVQNQQQKEEDTRSRSQKIGDAINKIHNITGPVATVANDAKNIYSAYTTIFGQSNKNKNNNTQNKAQDMAKIANSVQTINKGVEAASNKINEVNNQKQQDNKPQNVQKPVENTKTSNDKTSNVNKKASENLKAIQRENAKNTKVVDQVSNMINTSKSSSESSNKQPVAYARSKINNDYLYRQSTDVLNIMKDNISDDVKRTPTNDHAYLNQQKATLEEINKILRDRKRR